MLFNSNGKDKTLQKTIYIYLKTQKLLHNYKLTTTTTKIKYVQNIFEKKCRRSKNNVDLKIVL